ncbi:zonadhesin-like [Dermacentor silvarum]|uniref:zonadhesin-like n=1 Tax=Dermacentor silvarum TaxID=543639 RepID=UPI00189B459E|nr:zonadhesin-like [Dermacentor silvarum]
MQRIAVVLATICIVAVSGDHNCTKSGGCGGPSTCGPLEVPVQGKPRQDSFCRPLFTPAWELHKLRSCVCKQRYLRNSWGECIPRKKCIPCKFRWQRDYRTCAPGCPATCNMPFGTSCNKPCTAGCDCPPGWVVHPKLPKMCIKAKKCLPKCPANSSFQSCVSNCRPKCGDSQPNRCDFQCDKGACICKKGYVELERGGQKSCILEAMCPTHARTKPLFKPNITLNTGGGERVPVTANITRGVVGPPGSTALLAPSGHVSTSSTAELGGSTVSTGTGGTHSPITAGTAGNVLPVGY